MKKIIYQLVKRSYVIGIVFFISACAASTLLVNIKTEKDPNANFAQYRTYNWYQPNPAASTQPGSNLHNHLRQAIESEINKKGLQKVSSNPQVLLAYDVSIKRPDNLPSQTYPEGFGYSYAYQMGYRYDYRHSNISGYQAVDSYKPGTLIVDVIDASTRELIWRGWADDVVSNFNADYQTVENYVDDIVDKYPTR